MSPRRRLWPWQCGEEPEEKEQRQSAPQEGSSQQNAGLRAGTQLASSWDVKAVEAHGRGLARGELCLAPSSFLLMKGVPVPPKPGVCATMQARRWHRHCQLWGLLAPLPPLSGWAEDTLSQQCHPRDSRK